MEGGGVFLCPWSPEGGTCDIINFDLEGEFLTSLLVQSLVSVSQLSVMNVDVLSQVMRSTEAQSCCFTPSRVGSGLELRFDQSPTHTYWWDYTPHWLIRLCEWLNCSNTLRVWMCWPPGVCTTLSLERSETRSRVRANTCGELLPVGPEDRNVDALLPLQRKHVGGRLQTHGQQ